MNLDCEAPEIAIKSVAAILGTDAAQIETRLGGLGEKDFQPNGETENDRWLPIVKAVANRELDNFESGHTCWFHATRVKNVGSFHNGIYALPRQLDETWAALYPIVADCISPQEWGKFRREVENDYYGRSQMVNEAWMSNEGPYAFLVAEAALDPGDTGNHDYLKTSELVEDIAGCFKRKYGVNLHDRHHAATRPALIKFTTPGIKAFHEEAVLNYLFRRMRKLSLTCVSPCFSGEGIQIAPGQMLKAIPVVQVPGRFRNHNCYSLTPPSCHERL